MATSLNTLTAGRGCGWFRPVIAVGALILLLQLSPSADAAAVTATLDRQTVGVGETVTLVLTFEGAALPSAPALPALTNLTFASVMQGSEITIINGQRSSRQNFSYGLTAAKVGDTTIPAMQFQVGGQVLATPPLKVNIVPSAADAGLTNLAFLRLLVARTEVYLGESFPVELHLYWQNAQDIQMPQIKADGFSISQVPKPGQTRTQMGAVVYNLAVFKFSAAAAKVGNFTFGPAEENLTLQIPVNDARRRDPFGGFFGPNVQLRPVTLRSEAPTMRVLPLPLEGQPANFNGAVGNYALSVSAGPTNLAVGDPITVKIQISGQGRPESLTLPAEPQWREFTTYPPDGAFDARDPLGLSGTKSFTQVVIPQNHEIKELPPFSFSFFDPQAKRYQTLTGRATPLQVRSSFSSTPSLVLTNANAAGPPPAATDIVHIKQRAELAATLQAPLVRQPWFLALQAVPLLAWLGLVLRRKSREALSNNPRLRRQRQVARFIRDGLGQLRDLAAANKSDDFFAALFRLLQEQLGERLDLPASAITEAVIEERLRPRGAPGETLTALHELFQTCNLARYAPLKSSQELAALIPKVEDVLRQLQNIKE